MLKMRNRKWPVWSEQRLEVGEGGSPARGRGRERLVYRPALQAPINLKVFVPIDNRKLSVVMKQRSAYLI